MSVQPSVKMKFPFLHCDHIETSTLYQEPKPWLPVPRRSLALPSPPRGIDREERTHVLVPAAHRHFPRLQRVLDLASHTSLERRKALLSDPVSCGLVRYHHSELKLRF